MFHTSSKMMPAVTMSDSAVMVKTLRTCDRHDQCPVLWPAGEFIVSNWSSWSVCLANLSYKREIEVIEECLQCKYSSWREYVELSSLLETKYVPKISKNRFNFFAAFLIPVCLNCAVPIGALIIWGTSNCYYGENLDTSFMIMWYV